MDVLRMARSGLRRLKTLGLPLPARTGAASTARRIYEHPDLRRCVTRHSSLRWQDMRDPAWGLFGASGSQQRQDRDPKSLRPSSQRVLR